MSSTSSDPGVFMRDGKKVLIPLENNPDVFTDLIHRLGISSDLGFYDIYSIDEPALLDMVPRPCHAVIFISPADVWHRVRAAHDTGSKELTYNGSGAVEPVIWFKQTIGNACGLYSLIHGVGNGSAKQFIKPDSLVDRLLTEAEPLKPFPRADILYNSDELEKAHMASAVKGDSKAPDASERCGYHFITFVKGKDGQLWEMEGGWNGPIARGALEGSEDCLSDRAIELGVRMYLREAQGNTEFSMVALATRPK
ncbi:hypothetical protein DOTSEDRAFT_74099 [Dothistroma septosporum NZE10]|uniref:Ubiquitin carboxyl-terminal hydrolase n=1 Tax=Dothistroma septosporum (strain NZE10 / CBS 128990) TaxID=675120 RepID=N1PHU0_DOTSN|nr:hypothetical protein DOTSEDRAFT_74099 [Dothistroma septosporum NZE10]